MRRNSSIWENEIYLLITVGWFEERSVQLVQTKNESMREYNLLIRVLCYKSQKPMR